MKGKYIVEGQAKNLLQEDWDYLIILDACRYDFFKKYYKKYIKKGQLKKAISPAKNTQDWLTLIFQDFYEDIVYISSNPFVNSIGPRREVEFNAKKHFKYIEDVWDWDWDENLGTVPPEKVLEAFYKVKSKYSDKRFILHFMQPHAPYISKNYVAYIPNRVKIRRKIKIKKLTKQLSKLRPYAAKLIRLVASIFGDIFVWKIQNFFGIHSQIELIYQKEGKKGIRKAYKENLEIVLKSMSSLLDNLNGYILPSEISSM